LLFTKIGSRPPYRHAQKLTVSQFNLAHGARNRKSNGKKNKCPVEPVTARNSWEGRKGRIVEKEHSERGVI